MNSECKRKARKGQSNVVELVIIGGLSVLRKAKQGTISTEEGDSYFHDQILNYI